MTRDGVPLRVTVLTALPVHTATMAAPTVLNAAEEHSQSEEKSKSNPSLPIHTYNYTHVVVQFPPTGLLNTHPNVVSDFLKGFSTTHNHPYHNVVT